jgi:hypothetical protein
MLGSLHFVLRMSTQPASAVSCSACTRSSRRSRSPDRPWWPWFAWLQVCEGDVVVVDVMSHLRGLETALHWHGQLQRGSPYMDGVPMITQCPIQSETYFRYKFRASNPGTHFYHSHYGKYWLDWVSIRVLAIILVRKKVIINMKRTKRRTILWEADSHLVKKFVALGTRTSIVVTTRAHHWALFWIRLIQSTPNRIIHFNIIIQYNSFPYKFEYNFV